VWLAVTGGSCLIQPAGPKSVHSGNGWPLIVPRCLLLMLVITPLRTAAVLVSL